MTDGRDKRDADCGGIGAKRDKRDWARETQNAFSPPFSLSPSESPRAPNNVCHGPGFGPGDPVTAAQIIGAGAADQVNRRAWAMVASATDEQRLHRRVREVEPGLCANSLAWSALKASRREASTLAGPAATRDVVARLVEAWRGKPKAPEPPECFGVYRSGQWDAEACCDECRFDAACHAAWKARRVPA